MRSVEPCTISSKGQRLWPNHYFTHIKKIKCYLPGVQENQFTGRPQSFSDQLQENLLFEYSMKYVSVDI